MVNHFDESFLKDASFSRLFFGRGQKEPLPYNIDRLNQETILVSCYEEIDLSQFEEIKCPHIIIQNRYTRPIEFFALKGELKEYYDVEENGALFRVYLDGNQNIGLFPEMRVLKQELQNKSKGKRILNMFSYTCSFSVHCAVGGAREIHNIDMMKSALVRGRLNHQLNKIDLSNIYFHNHNIKKSWGLLRRKGPYDLIIFDPPSFQGKNFDARRDYSNMLKKLPELLGPNGELVLCLNSPHISYDELLSWATESLYDMSFEKQIEVGEECFDHGPHQSVKIQVWKKK